MHLLVCRIHRSETNQVERGFAEWEIPILQHIYAGQVEIVGETENSRPYPDPYQEFDRLAKLYKNEEQSGTPLVAAVYGLNGVEQLAKRIHEVSRQHPFKPRPTQPRVRPADPQAPGAAAELSELRAAVAKLISGQQALEVELAQANARADAAESLLAEATAPKPAEGDGVEEIDPAA